MLTESRCLISQIKMGKKLIYWLPRNGPRNGHIPAAFPNVNIYLLSAECERPAERSPFSSHFWWEERRSFSTLVEVFTFFSEKIDEKCLLFFTTFSTRKVCEKLKTFSLISCFISNFSPGGGKGLKKFWIFHILFWWKMREK